MNGNLIEVLLQNAAVFPDKVALIHQSKRCTFKELADEVKKVAEFLHEKGIGKGDRVLIFVPISLALYQIILALFYLGATAVFIDAWANRKRLSEALKLVDCKAFIGIPRSYVLQLITPEIGKIPVKLTVGIGRFKIERALGLKYQPVAPEDTALITFTTGSTSLPKAANRTFGFLWEQHLALQEHLQLQPAETVMTTLPVFVLHNLAVGCTSVIPDADPRKPEKVDARRIAAAIKQEKVEVAIASPVFFEKLAGSPVFAGVDYLRRIFLGGAPVYPRLARKLCAAFPNTAIEIVYGSTEAEPISFISATRLLASEMNTPGLWVGKPVSGINVAIIEITDGPVENCEPEEFAQSRKITGEIGEICVAGPFVLQEYFNSALAWRLNKFLVGETIWHRTGDAGYVDSENNLFLMGRVKQRLVIREDIVYVFPIENRLLDIPGVKIGTILQVNDLIHIVVELQGRKFQAKQVQAEIAALNIGYQRLCILKKIPRDPRHNSKIDYERLKKLLAKTDNSEKFQKAK